MHDEMSIDAAKDKIAELCRAFYAQGWVSGTGGGVSLRVGDAVVMAPSGVAKETLTREMMFTVDMQGGISSSPDHALGLRLSQCAPLFLAAMNQRGAGAVLHSHSKNAVLATLLTQSHSIRLTRLEMLKGLEGVGFDDVHELPVIDNTAHECDLTDSLAAAIDAYPRAHAVLVRRHGIYVWGKDWQAAKRHVECYDYLLGLVLEAKTLGIDLLVA